MRNSAKFATLTVKSALTLYIQRYPVKSTRASIDFYS
jgi:hypothetical protein